MILRRTLAAAFAVATLLPGKAFAAVLCVNPGGTGGCFPTIQQAIDAAARRDVIEIAAGTYVESFVVPPRSRLTIRGAGAGATVVDGGGAGTVVEVQGPGAQLTVEGLTIRNGNRGVHLGTAAKVRLASCEVLDNVGGSGIVLDERANLTIDGCTIADNSNAIPGGGIRADSRRARITIVGSTLEGNTSLRGGGLFSLGRVHITDSTVRGNTAVEEGGGVFANNLQVIRSTVSGNSANIGGGIASYFLDRAQVRITDSTISGNSASRAGGIAAQSTLRLDHVTVANNTAAVRGGGIGTAPAFEQKAIFRGTILADNSAPEGADCDNVKARLFAGNLIESDTCTKVIAGRSPLLTDDPLLGPLQNNGGPTETQALGAGSPAIGVLTTRSLCRQPDQRGVARAVPCDLGAYEAP